MGSMHQMTYFSKNENMCYFDLVNPVFTEMSYTSIPCEGHNFLRTIVMSRDDLIEEFIFKYKKKFC